MAMKRDKQKRVFSIVLPLSLFISALVPRALVLDAFLTIDERAWRGLTPAFLRALHQRDWTATYQISHPGVTVMWTLVSGLYSSYLAQNSILSGSQTDLNDWQGFFTKALADPFAVNLLTVERLPFALVSCISVILVYFLLRKLFGSKAAFLCTVLLSYEPLYLAYSRLILPDALMSGFMIISVLALMVYLKRDHLLSLIISACSAALAFLTKWPALLLVPIEGLVIATMLLSRWRRRETRRLREDVLRLGIVVVGWGIITAFVLYAFWPAMWVDFGGTIRRMWATINELSPTAATSHFQNPDFFWGKVTPTLDPGPFFYPIAIIARLTPPTLAGILLIVPSLSEGRYKLSKTLDCKAEIVSLAIYVCLFGGLMSLGVIKTDRYILPLFPALNVLAGLGWYGFIASLISAWNIKSEKEPTFWIGALALILFFQAGFSLPHFPYFLTYYNPLIGGGQQAVNLIRVGWGEGMDKVASYLNNKKLSTELRVASWYGHMQTTFVGTEFSLTQGSVFWNEPDYVVFYVSQVQRQIPDPTFIHGVRSWMPLEHTVRTKGIDYAWIYRVPQGSSLPGVWAEFPDSLVPAEHLQRVQFGDKLLFLGYDTIVSYYYKEAFDGKLRIHLYWRALREMGEDYTIYLKLINDAYHVWGQQDGRPYWDGLPTNSWKKGQVVGDKREIDVLPGTPPGLYRVEVILLDLQSGHTLEPEGGGSMLLGPIEVPRWELPSVDDLDIEESLEVNLGNKVQLLGYNIESGFRPGDNIHLTLFWQCLEEMEQSYTVFTHLVDAEDNIVVQKDNPPVDGFYPTMKWEVGEIVRDQYDMVIPPEAPPGQYRLEVGMYLAETGERLSVLKDGVPLPNNQILLQPVPIGSVE